MESRELRLVPIVLLATDMVPLELPWDRIIKIINIIIKNWDSKKNKTFINFLKKKNKLIKSEIGL